MPMRNDYIAVRTRCNTNLVTSSEKLFSLPCASRKKDQVSVAIDDGAWLGEFGEGERSVGELDIEN